MSEQPIQEHTTDFEALGLHPDILAGVVEAGFRAASPIQAQAIPVVLAGRDLIGQAHTGTGKTAAFGLPAMSRIAGRKGVGLLVITPTRELATQVSDELHRLGRHADIRTATVYGGQPYRRQIEHIERGAQVVVATPGRLLDLLKG
ncbi:MAG TPA: DEAD/DEAH box helicase, partial [Mariprofundaceae bacterium]|nr:DEAD/DEAH box helicase [Mariprofundaceae bacterium]